MSEVVERRPVSAATASSRSRPLPVGRALLSRRSGPIRNHRKQALKQSKADLNIRAESTA